LILEISSPPVKHTFSAIIKHMAFRTSQESYDNEIGAKNYLDFLASEDGKFFRHILHEAFSRRLEKDPSQRILDVACGPGWLSHEISKTHPNIEACDGSRYFLEHARKEYPEIKFNEVNLNNRLIYADNEFNTLIMSMAAHDVEDQVKTFTELHRIIRPGGKLMLTMVNPYYAFPVGVWKRGIIGRLLMRRPKLLVRPYHWLAGKESRNFTFNKTLECYFYKMSEHLNNITEAGFCLRHMQELESKDDSKTYDLKYRMHRFPVIIYLEFTKPA
jgi:ubiquinone/menaquinone biosynthesis C-methylase UbiE